MDVMRMGGLASGMDIEDVVDRLMETERMPLNRLEQQQTELTWKRDAFRNINSTLLELDDMMLDMKLSSTYESKTATSSQDGSVTARANSKASNGTYNIEVTSLAQNEMWTSERPVKEDVDVSQYAGTQTFRTFDEDGKAVEHELEIAEDDSLHDIVKKINETGEGNISAFYDDTSKKVFFETSRTGIYNEDGSEIEFDTMDNQPHFFSEVLHMEQQSEAENATFKYNGGSDIESHTNNYTMNGIDFEFNNTTNGSARISIASDVEEAYEKIENFVEGYNQTIAAMNKSQTEEKARDYPPLTAEQKAEMSEKEIEQWEEKSKSGILRGESSLQSGMYSLRQSMQSQVESGGEYNLLSQVGINTTQDYLDGGKLEIDEEKLKSALQENSEAVHKLFSNSEKGDGKGLIHRFDDTLDQVRGNIERKAGKSTHTLDNYSIGRQVKDVNERIVNFEGKLEKTEERYWNQFTQMEKAISQLNEQSEYMNSQFSQ